MSSQTDFVSQYLPYAQQAATATGNNPYAILTQWALETGYGQHFAGTNNLGNVSPGGKVASYPDLSSGVAAYEYALQYEGVTNQSNPANFFQALQSKGYATDPNYAGKLMAVYGSMNPAQVSKAAVDPANSPLVAGATDAGAKQAIAAGDSVNQQRANSNNALGWIQSKIGDFGLIVLGGALVVGALVISNRETVIKLGEGLAA